MALLTCKAFSRPQSLPALLTNASYTLKELAIPAKNITIFVSGRDILFDIPDHYIYIGAKEIYIGMETRYSKLKTEECLRFSNGFITILGINS